MQAKIESVMGAAPDSSSVSATRAEEGKMNSWSVYVGNMDYAYTSGKVQQYLQPNGTKSRVTILTDEFRSTNKIRWYGDCWKWWCLEWHRLFLLALKSDGMHKWTKPTQKKNSKKLSRFSTSIKKGSFSDRFTCALVRNPLSRLGRFTKCMICVYRLRRESNIVNWYLV